MDSNNDNSDLPGTEISVAKPIMKRYYYIKVLYKFALIFLGYFICYMNWSMTLLVIAAMSIIWLESQDNLNATKIKTKASSVSSSQKDLMKKIDEIPSWVKFPDRERAEWLNQVIAQLWPTLNSYVIKVFRNSIQTKIRKKHESFEFESIDFGQTPPKIDGIKVYNSTLTKDSIIVDFDVFYDGDCDINFSLSGAEVGGIRDFQLSAEVRVVLKPLLLRMPLIGGIQVYFLNTPNINFTLDGLSGIPGLSAFIRTKIEEKITKLVVFPNKVTKRFSKSVEPSELKALEPAGVLRVHVFEAKDLMAKDITGKSDPYTILYVGAQEYRTSTINQNLNPKWDDWCEFVIIDPKSQHIGFKLYDHDNVNEDDFLGSGEVEISSVLKGDVDQWIVLDGAKHGSIHLRFTWLSLSSDMNLLNAITEETKQLQVENISRAILILYVDAAKNLPEAKHFVKPNAYFVLQLGKQKEKSKVKKHTRDPAWEQGFVFLVPNPNQDILLMTIMDKTSGNVLTQFTYRIQDLTKKPNLQTSKEEFALPADGCTITMSLELKILSNELFEFDSDSTEDTETDSESPIGRDAGVPGKNLLRSPSKKNTEETMTSMNLVSDMAAPSISLLSRSLSSSSYGEYRLGRLDLSFNYNELRQRLVVTIHQVSHLPVKDPSDLPDPYVKLKLLANGRSIGSTYKSKIKMDTCSPVFDETFEYVMSKNEAYEQTVLITVKSKKKSIFSDGTIGQVEVNLKYCNLTEGCRSWYDLSPKDS